ncbi:Pyridine nucleotide-disulfide oxidoreductase/FAD dependent oxidoreductase [Leishmania naiffi]|uniref:FAD-dependent oxidoreductase domain-containing protein 1 n=1 Tax=Leishmania naiffi TaxID=5678 RepID=A0AAW3B6B7_9TRYP
MGQRGSRMPPVDTPVGDSVSPNLTERLSLTAPSAAVIGAGVAGVHVAYELARLGFKVTVFERRGDIAGGETRDSLPFVGVGLIEPSLTRTALRNEVLRGMMFPTTCPDLIAREHLFNTLLNPVVYRWMWGRARSCFSDVEVMAYTNNLSCVSHSVVCELVKKYPHLHQHVFAGPITVLNEQKEPAVTAHAAPLMIDPVGWTRALADVCARYYGVQFALGERLEDTVTYLKYNVESTRSIRVSKPDPLHPEQRLFACEGYDVVVLAAGASTGTMTLPNSRLPVLGLSGLSAVVQQPNGALKDAIRSLFQGKPRRRSSAAATSFSPGADALSNGDGVVGSLARPTSGTLALLSSHCSLYGYTWPSTSSSTNSHDGLEGSSSAVASMMQSKVLPTPQDVVLQGLLSLDSTAKTETRALVLRQLDRLESYLRIKCGWSVPLSSFSTSTETERGSNVVRVREYVRAFTPDGVPIVDHNGGSFNCFVCCGFGDHAMDFAPGAAKVLGKLVEHQAQRLREEDIEKVKSWGLLTSKLSPSRRTEVEEELRLLFSGVNPEAVTRKQPMTGSEAPTLTWLRPEGNPYSTNRFINMVRKEVKVDDSPSILSRFYAFEEGLLTRLEPYRRRFHAKATELALRENMPDWLHTIVFCYMYEEDDSPDAQARKEKHLRSLQRLASQYETPVADAKWTGNGAEERYLTSTEHSKRQQTELERRVREVFTKRG